MLWGPRIGAIGKKRDLTWQSLSAIGVGRFPEVSVRPVLHLHGFIYVPYPVIPITCACAVVLGSCLIARKNYYWITRTRCKCVEVNMRKSKNMKDAVAFHQCRAGG